MITGFTDYHNLVIEVLHKGYWGSLGDVASVIWHARKQKRIVLTCGNGGSAATAIHFAADLRTLGVQAHDLLSPVKVTQICNDHGFEYIFSDQAEVFERPLIIAFSCSGVSPNIANVCRAFDSILFAGNTSAGSANLCVCVLEDDCEIIEDIHLMMCHALKKMVGSR